MIVSIWELLLRDPILNFLLFTSYYFGSLGVSIIILTLVIKLILLPLNIPTIKMQNKKGVLDEELKTLKEKYKDKNELAKAQMELYKKHGVNPASGCLPLIVQIVVFFTLYKVLTDLLHNNVAQSALYFDYLKGFKANTLFLYLNLAKPDPYYILPILAAISQFFMTKIMMPAAKKGVQLAEKTKTSTDDVMYNMQQQMLFISPIMTLVIGITLPSGLSLYWFISTLFSIVQTYIINKFIKK